MDFGQGSMKSNVILLGQRFNLIKKLKQRGYNVILVDENPNSEADKVIHVLEEMASLRLSEIDIRQFEFKDVEAVIPNTDLFVELTAKIREELYPHTLGIGFKESQNVRDKLKTKIWAKQNNMAIAKFSSLENFSYDDLSKHLGRTFLIKPKKLILARGIKKISSQSDWSNWHSKNKNILSQFYAEEFVENFMELSCDTIVSGGKILAQFPCEYSVNCLESNEKHEGFGAIFPPHLGEEEILNLKALAAKVVQCFNIETGYCHIEFLKSDRGILFGEVGVRLAGGLHPATESLVLDQDIEDIFLDLYLNPKHISLEARDKYLGYYLFPKKPGKVVSIQNKLDTVSWVLTSKINISVGEIIPWEDSSVASSATTIFEAASPAELKERIELVKKLFSVEMA